MKNKPKYKIEECVDDHGTHYEVLKKFLWIFYYPLSRESEVSIDGLGGGMETIEFKTLEEAKEYVGHHNRKCRKTIYNIY